MAVCNAHLRLAVMRPRGSETINLYEEVNKNRDPSKNNTQGNRIRLNS